MVDNALVWVMEEKIKEYTYELYEMLGYSSYQKSARGRRIWVNGIGFGKEATMQLVKLIKQVQLFTTKNISNHELCGVCGTFRHSANVCYFVGDSS